MAILVLSSAPAAEEQFSFALLGDVPYGPQDAALFPQFVEDVINDVDVRLVAHAGDIKSGLESCADADLTVRFDMFQGFEDPFWLTPGDNDWMDCRLDVTDPAWLPTERLEFFRGLFFPDPATTTGSTTRPVNAQSMDPGFEDYVENTRFSESFGAIHVVGSSNGNQSWVDETRPNKIFVSWR